MAGATDIGAQGRRRRAACPAEGDAPTGEGVDGAGSGVAAVGMADDLASLAVLLVVEGEGDVRGTVQIGGGRRDGV